jgi:hypothetical protein
VICPANYTAKESATPVENDGYFLGMALATVSSLHDCLQAIYLLFHLASLLLFVVLGLRSSSEWNPRFLESVEDCGSKRQTVVNITPFPSLPFLLTSLNQINTIELREVLHSLRPRVFLAVTSLGRLGMLLCNSAAPSCDLCSTTILPLFKSTPVLIRSQHLSSRQYRYCRHLYQSLL